MLNNLQVLDEKTRSLITDMMNKTINTLKRKIDNLSNNCEALKEENAEIRQLMAKAFVSFVKKRFPLTLSLQR